jgi:hypothetical protein
VNKQVRIDKASARIEVVYRPIGDLTLDPGNPRQHAPRQVRQIAQSIQSFGFNVPILIDGNLKVVAGHGRILACRKLGWNEVPTICLEHLSEAQAKAFMIADNRLTEISTWDDRLLAEQLKALSVFDLDFSLEITGFDMGEIDLRIESLNPQSEVKPDPADDLSRLPSGPSASRLGDLWRLNRHRVICGSALDAEAYTRLMGTEKAAFAFTDPPYNVPIAGNVSGLGAISHREFPMASGEMSETEFTSFLTAACGLLAQHGVDGSVHNICMDWRHMAELSAAGNAVYGSLLNLCIWVC